MMDQIDPDFHLCQIVPDFPGITITDVGAMPFGDTPEIYTPLVENFGAKVIGFEPSKGGVEALRKRLGPPHEVFPYVIGDGRPGVFHINKEPMTSSLLESNTPVISNFTQLSEVMELVSTEPVSTYRLDDVIRDDVVDFLKIDTQGAELHVLSGAKHILSSVVAIHIEVCFVEMYKSQPLFGDVDMHLRDAGFQLHTLIDISSRYFKPLSAPNISTGGLNQCLWADAVYIPALDRLETLSAEKFLKLAAIAQSCYRSFDLSLHVLKRLSEAGTAQPYRAFCKRLGF